MDCLKCGEEVQAPTEFISFPKIPRLSRECIITEKIDGTNAQIHINEDGTYKVGSRSRWIQPGNDNFGFAQWVEQNITELKKLGPGRHFGEWWGLGIQRGYSLFERRFTLFRAPKSMVEKPSCVSFVPVLNEGPFNDQIVQDAIMKLQIVGSYAAPGYMKPEGIVIYHKASGQMFKKTIEHDEEAKEARDRRLSFQEKTNATSNSSTTDTSN